MFSLFIEKNFIFFEFSLGQILNSVWQIGSAGDNRLVPGLQVPAPEHAKEQKKRQGIAFDPSGQGCGKVQEQDSYRNINKDDQ